MIYLGIIAAVKTGFNLRFEDPSMTAPQARMELLLMGTGTSSLLYW